MVQQTRSYLIVTLVLIGAFIFAGCRGAREEPTPAPFNEDQEDTFIGMPNPASFYCEEMGYELELRDTDGGAEGICKLPNGAECEEWDFLAGGCSIEWTYCQRQGYSIQKGADGAICTFNDGSTCQEYEFFIGECQPPQ